MGAVGLQTPKTQNDSFFIDLGWQFDSILAPWGSLLAPWQGPWEGHGAPFWHPFGTSDGPWEHPGTPWDPDPKKRPKKTQKTLQQTSHFGGMFEAICHCFWACLSSEVLESFLSMFSIVFWTIVAPIWKHMLRFVQSDGNLGKCNPSRVKTTFSSFRGSSFWNFVGTVSGQALEQACH